MLEKQIAFLNLYKQALDFAHWKAVSNYADHLLYDRLRKEISSQIDVYVERQLFDKNTNFEVYRTEAILALQNYSGTSKQDLRDFATFLLENIKEDDDLTKMLKQHIYLLKEN